MQGQIFDGEVEFLFIDGGSSDGTRELLDELGQADERVKRLDNPDRHIPSALNIGLRHAAGTYVARMDAHTHYPPDYLQLGVDRLARGDVAWVSGPALPFGAGRWSRRVELALNTWLGVGGAGLPSSRRGGVRQRHRIHRPLAPGHAAPTRGWDEESLVNEDAELAARIRAAGERIVCVPAMAARYVPRNSLAVTRPAVLALRHLPRPHQRASSREPAPIESTAPGTRTGANRGAVGPTTARSARPRGARRLRGRDRGRERRGRAACPAIGDAARLPLVFVVMHLAWGFGFLAGSLRFGPPHRAVVQALRFPLRGRQDPSHPGGGRGRNERPGTSICPLAPGPARPKAGERWDATHTARWWSSSWSLCSAPDRRQPARRSDGRSTPSRRRRR